MKLEARIIVLGDDNVGKTSIIATLVEEKFVEDVPLVLSDVFIPAEIVSEGVPMYITDTSNRLENKAALEADIRRNDSIVLVYDVANAESFERISSYWVPFLKSLDIDLKPIILVGNKIDTRGEYVVNEGLEDVVVPVMNESPNMEVCVECSAKLNLNIADIFLYALKFAMYPTWPLYDGSDKILRPKCIEALARIFRIFDKNNDGFLDDEEFNQLHVTTFETVIQAHEMEDIKAMIREAEGSFMSFSKGLSLSEFLTLHLHFIQRGRSETTWKMLRKFGYDDSLALSESYLRPRFEISVDCSAELTAKSCQFLVELFKKFDIDSDGSLNPDEVDSLFKMSGGSPWVGPKLPLSVPLRGKKRLLSLNDYLAQWHYTALMDPHKTVELLAYFGFPNPLSQGIRVTPSRSLDRSKGRCSRQVLRCWMLGAMGAGKSTLLKRFRGELPSEPIHEESPSSCARAITSGIFEKYVILEEVTPTQVRSQLHNAPKDYLANKMDLVILAYDASDPNSFSYIAGLAKELKLESVPVLVIATKMDLGIPVKQRYPVQPKDFCRQRHWLAPKETSLTSPTFSIEPLLHDILEVAMHPQASMTQQSKSSLHRWIYWMTVSTTLAGAAYGGFILYNRYKKTH